MNGRSARGLFVAALAVVVLLATGHLARADFFEFQKLLADDGTSLDFFGYSVAISGDYAIVGAYGDGAAGSAYIFNWTGSSWNQQAKLTATGGAVADSFGSSVGISGDYAIVGAYGDDGTGSAYTFNRSGTTWTEQAKLTASDGAPNDLFGISVGISGDYAIVGAQGDDGFSGSAYVFNRSGTTWTEQGKLTASDRAGDNLFGTSVDISGDFAIVGAPRHDESGTYSGSAYIYERSGSSWGSEQELTASDAAAYDHFGSSVAISGDDAIVGAYAAEGDNGSAYVYHRSGSSWGSEQELTASDGAASDFFGSSVGISGDYAIVGAYWDDDNGYDSGSAYIYERSGSSWGSEVKLTASDGASWDYFGYSVGIWGERAIVGAYYDDDNGSLSGSAYMYHTPEPSGLVALVGLGLMGCAGHLWRRRKRTHDEDRRGPPA